MHSIGDGVVERWTPSLINSSLTVGSEDFGLLFVFLILVFTFDCVGRRVVESSSSGSTDIGATSSSVNGREDFEPFLFTFTIEINFGFRCIKEGSSSSKFTEIDFVFSKIGSWDF